MEGLIEDLINNIELKEDNNNLIFSDEELNSGKLKKIYEKSTDPFVKNRDVYDYYTIEGTDQNTNPLPVKYQKKLKYDFKININKNIPINLLECISLVANQIPKIKNMLHANNFNIPSGDFTYKIVRNLFIKYIEKMENIKEGDIPYWKYLIKSYTEDNKEDLDKIENFKDFEGYIKDDHLHWYNKKDLEIIHHLFEINVIIMSRKTSDNTGFEVLFNDKYNYYILLYVNKISNTNKKKYELVSLYEKHVFFFQDFSEEFKETVTENITKGFTKIKKKKNKIKLVKDEAPVILKINKKKNKKTF